jgi:hypothetical protein
LYICVTHQGQEHSLVCTARTRGWASPVRVVCAPLSACPARAAAAASGWVSLLLPPAAPRGAPLPHAWAGWWLGIAAPPCMGQRVAWCATGGQRGWAFRTSSASLSLGVGCNHKKIQMCALLGGLQELDEKLGQHSQHDRGGGVVRRAHAARLLRPARAGGLRRRLCWTARTQAKSNLVSAVCRLH